MASVPVRSEVVAQVHSEAADDSCPGGSVAVDSAEADCSEQADLAPDDCSAVPPADHCAPAAQKDARSSSADSVVAENLEQVDSVPDDCSGQAGLELAARVPGGCLEQADSEPAVRVPDDCSVAALADRYAPAARLVDWLERDDSPDFRVPVGAVRDAPVHWPLALRQADSQVDSQVLEAELSVETELQL